jgi:hypothetical protein
MFPSQSIFGMRYLMVAAVTPVAITSPAGLPDAVRTAEHRYRNIAAKSYRVHALMAFYAVTLDHLDSATVCLPPAPPFCCR